VCTRQSNMELNVKDARDGIDEAILAEIYKNIRLHLLGKLPQNQRKRHCASTTPGANPDRNSLETVTASLPSAFSLVNSSERSSMFLLV
jgi:hypothetical protein